MTQYNYGLISPASFYTRRTTHTYMLRTTCSLTLSVFYNQDVFELRQSYNCLNLKTSWFLLLDEKSSFTIYYLQKHFFKNVTGCAHPARYSSVVWDMLDSNPWKYCCIIPTLLSCFWKFICIWVLNDFAFPATNIVCWCLHCSATTHYLYTPCMLHQQLG